MSGIKYGSPGLARKVYEVSADNPILDEKFQRTVQEVRDRLEALREVLDAVPVGMERDTVQEEIQRLEGLLAL